MNRLNKEAVKVTLFDGSIEEVPTGMTIYEILEKKLGKKGMRDVVLARVDGQPRDLFTALDKDCTLEPVYKNEPEALETLRHSTAHIMAEAVKELFPEVKVAIGPAVEQGFYYDFDYKRPFTPEDLKKIESKMKRIIKKGVRFERRDVPIHEAKARFESMGETYKVELIEELEQEGEKEVSIYSQDGFEDLCRGPHIPHSGYVKAFKLTGVAGAYWRGDESKPMLQRIYGTAFFSKDELKKHLERLEEAKKRDHRRIGRELDLFSIQEEVGPGLVLWHPKGSRIRKAIEDFWRKAHLDRGYEMLFTPHIAKRELWKRSGHLDFYAENMYAPMQIDEVEYQIKPMNCPFHIAVYNSRRRSYRELPLRWCELGTVYRYERTGTLHGLMRVRGFTQDDAHVFCRLDQLDSEIHDILDMTLYVLRVFGFDRYDIYLSTRPDKYVGSEENWERATNALKQALEAQGLEYEIDPGEGVFYGPKIDIKIKDCLDRSWQCSTIQVDFNLPERFDVKYIGEDSHPHAPIMIHRALLGSLERFFGVLIEHYAGAFPLWLAPVQASVLTVTNRQDDWAVEVLQRLKAAGLRAQADLRNEKLGKKIREAQLEKVPYMIIIGDKEAEQGLVSPRRRDGEQLEACSVDEFIKMAKEEIESVFSLAIKGRNQD